MKADIIYLCSPNNPTGAVYTREQLTAWVQYALAQGAVLLFDAAYESYISDPSLPHSIYEIEGAERCAIEINSLSKMAGFTGVRCGWTVVPSALKLDGASLHDMWFRRMSTKYNGTSYIIQRAAAKVFTEEGQAAVHEDIAYYMENARILKAALTKAGIWTTGGDNAPYVWLKAPRGLGSWEFFDELLYTCGIAGTPGVGFWHGRGGLSAVLLLRHTGNGAGCRRAARKAISCKISPSFMRTRGLRLSKELMRGQSCKRSA